MLYCFLAALEAMVGLATCLCRTVGSERLGGGSSFSLLPFLVSFLSCQGKMRLPTPLRGRERKGGGRTRVLPPPFALDFWCRTESFCAQTCIIALGSPCSRNRLFLSILRFHDLRHTAATLLLTKGVYPKIVQELLGHLSISITLDTYSHVLPNMQEKAFKAMQDVFEGS